MPKHVPKHRYKSLPNIRRIDGPKSYGYQVHVERDGNTITKLFSDSRYPSRMAARKAAIEYRDQVLAEAPTPLNRLGYRTKALSNTGEVGISLTFVRRSTGKQPVLTVSASPTPGKMMSRKYSIEKFGYEGAMERAKAWRNDVLQKRNARRTRRLKHEQLPVTAELQTDAATE